MDLIFGHATIELKQVANIYPLYGILLSTGEYSAWGCCLSSDLAISSLRVEHLLDKLYVRLCVCVVPSPRAAPLNSHPSRMESGTKSRPQQNTAVRALKTRRQLRKLLSPLRLCAHSAGLNHSAYTSSKKRGHVAPSSFQTSLRVHSHRPSGPLSEVEGVMSAGCGVVEVSEIRKEKCLKTTRRLKYWPWELTCCVQEKWVQSLHLNSSTLFFFFTTLTNQCLLV